MGKREKPDKPDHPKKFWKGQHQGQGQGQHQHQDQWAMQKVKSKNKNKNKNENENNNTNNNTNDVDNTVNNTVNDAVNNTVTNDVDSTVTVTVDIGLEGWEPQDNDVLDVDNIKFKDDLDGAFNAIANNVYQDVSGKGNDGAFNVQQINNMVDNDKAYDQTIKGNKLKGGVHAKAKGGDNDIDNVKAKIGESGSIQDVGNASADAALDQNVFAQNISQGANIQFNESSISHVGNDMDDSVLL